MSNKNKYLLDRPNLEGVSALFDEFGSTQVGVETLPLSKIQSQIQQPRKYFATKPLQDLANSIKAQGILEPLLVRPIAGELFELVAGERRYRAAKIAELYEVPVIIRELSDDEAFEVSLIENLQREDLNPIEETEAILKLISTKLNKPLEQVIALFHQTANQKRNSAQNVLRSSEWQSIEQIFNVLGRFTPSSFRSSRLGLLKLPSSILEALREGKIEYTKAIILGRIKDISIQELLLKETIEQNLTLTQIKEKLKQLQTDSNQEQPAIKQRLQILSSKIKQSKILDNPKTQKQLEKLVNDFESKVQKLIEKN